MGGMQYGHYSMPYNNNDNPNICECGKYCEPLKSKSKYNEDEFEFRCYCDCCEISWRV